MIDRRIETTELNQGLGIPGLYSAFTKKMSLILQILALIVGVPSCVCGLVNISLITNLHHNHVKFRHTILTIVFTLDFLKCIFFTIYTILQISHYNINDRPKAYNTLGYLTHMMITASDAMAFFLTWHFAVLVFKPKWKWYSKTTHTYEGGLFKFRYYIYAITIFYSILTSSLVLLNINTPIDLSSKDVYISKTKGRGTITHKSKLGGYKPYVTIIGVPASPYYYGLLFSWLFRYVALMSIFVVFLAIYVSYMIQAMRIRKRIKNLSEANNDIENQIEIIRLEFSNMVIDEFNKSQQKFKRQLNYLFLYPLSYFLLWLVPLVENIEQKYYDMKHGPIIPITIIVSLCHPANSLFETIIFFVIEKPLKFSWHRYQTNLIINNYLKVNNKSMLSVEDKYYLLYKTSYGRLKWYHSKEVKRLIKEGAIEEDTEQFKLSFWARLRNFYHHMLPLRKGINLDELHYKTNTPHIKKEIQPIEDLDKSVLSKSIRSFNINSQTDPETFPEDNWVVNILNHKTDHPEKSVQFKHILDDVHLADADIELESNFTANEDMDEPTTKPVESATDRDHSEENIDMDDFLNG